ncbi:uncharacterized protein UTRI_10209 [Ustilago trichophora]|uniref:Secreted protein n=1 Tax=Ustilago trichophora TaxID=86804 RepID=A0A5C3EH46_9BASI|nr:uncharacterized protein UTRI_10209 [Ustilago trichophora]
MVNFFGKIKLSAFLVVFATLSGALRKRADDDLDLNLRLGPPGPPRPASASHVSPVLNTKATHLRQTQSSAIQAQSRVQGQLFPPGMSNNKGGFIRSQEDSQGTFALPRHGIETGRLPPDAYYGRTLPPAQLRESPPSTTLRMFDSQGNGIGQGGAKYVPGLLDTSMPQTGNVHPNTGQGSTASSRARRLDSEPKQASLSDAQASLSDASRQWERYSSTYLGKSLPSVTHQGAFFPWAAEKFQERIDLLNLIKEYVLPFLSSSSFSLKHKRDTDVNTVSRIGGWQVIVEAQQPRTQSRGRSHVEEAFQRLES